jgi:hypothetical protein
MSQPLVDHTKLLALDVELEQNPIGGPLNITQNQDKIEEKMSEYFTRTCS